MRRVAAVLCLGLAAAYHPPAPCDALEREKAWVAERAGAEVGALRIDAAWLQPVDQGAAPPRCTLSVAKSAARGEEVARIPSATLLHTANIHFTRLGASLRHRAAFQPLAPGGSSARAESFSEDGETGGEEAALAQEERQALQQSWPWAAASSAAALVQDDHALLLALHILHEERCVPCCSAQPSPRRPPPLPADPPCSASASDPPSPWAPLLASLPRACVLPMCAGAGLLAEMRDDILRTHALHTRAEALALRAHLLPWLRSAAPHDMDLSRAGFLRAIAVARQRAVAVGGGEGGPLAIVPLVHAARQLPSAGPTPASGFDSVTSAFIVRSETAAPAGAELVLSRGRLPDRGVMDRFGALPLRQNPMETVLMDAAALPVGRGEEEEETEEMVAAREGVLAAHGVPRALWVPTVLPLTPQLVFAARLTVLSARPLHTLASTPPCAFHEELRGGRSGGGGEVGEGSACRPLSAPLEAAAMDRLARAALAKASPPGEPGLAEDDCTLFALSAACGAESSGGVSAADVWTWRMRYEFVRYRASRRRPYAALAAAATRISVAQARLATGAHSPQSSQSAESQQSAQPAESPQHAQYSPSGRSAGDAARAPAYRVAVPPPMPSLGRATTPAAAAGHTDAGPQLALRSFPAASRTTPPPPLSPSGPSSPQGTRPAAAAANAQNVLETATDAVGAATWRRGALSLGGTAVDAVQASADDVSPLSAMVDRSGREAGTRGRTGPHRSLWTPSDARRVVRDAVRAVVTDASGVIEHVAQGEGEGVGEDTTQGTRTVQAPPGEAATRVRQAVESAWEQASSSRLTQRAAVDTGDVVAAAAASLASGSGSAAAAAGDGDPAAEYAQLHRLLHEEWRRFEAQMEKVVSEVAGRVDVTALLRSYGNALGAGVPVVQTPPRGQAPFDGARMERVEAVLDEVCVVTRASMPCSPVARKTLRVWPPRRTRTAAWRDTPLRRRSGWPSRRRRRPRTKPKASAAKPRTAKSRHAGSHSYSTTPTRAAATCLLTSAPALGAPCCKPRCNSPFAPPSASNSPRRDTPPLAPRCGLWQNACAQAGARRRARA